MKNKFKAISSTNENHKLVNARIMSKSTCDFSSRPAGISRNNNEQLCIWSNASI